MFKWITRVGIIGLAIGALLAPTAQASNGDDESALAGVRAVTAPYHDVAVAMHANYLPLLSCFDYPGVGGMGQHYVDTSRLNGSIDPNRPQALVYEVDPDRLQLVAVEWIVPWSAWNSNTPPQQFGKSFTSVVSLQLWALHAWVWRPNPDGIFANYNPSVKLCPGH